MERHSDDRYVTMQSSEGDLQIYGPTDRLLAKRRSPPLTCAAKVLQTTRNQGLSVTATNQS
jgi:hypothetical protein